MVFDQAMCSVSNSGRILAYFDQEMGNKWYFDQAMCSVSNSGRILACFDQEMGSGRMFGLF